MVYLEYNLDSLLFQSIKNLFPVFVSRYSSSQEYQYCIMPSQSGIIWSLRVVHVAKRVNLNALRALEISRSYETLRVRTDWYYYENNKCWSQT